MNKRLIITFEEIDYCITTDWDFCEFPQLGDYIEVLQLCSLSDKTHLHNTPIPEILKYEEFRSTFDYLNYYQWIVIERWWMADSISIVCHKVDPLMV